MAYVKGPVWADTYWPSLGDAAVDFSQGTCGPGAHKPFPNSSCEALPYGQTLQESRGARDPFGFDVGAGKRFLDFSGGSCGVGMIRTSPTGPCRPIERGMSTGMGEYEVDWSQVKNYREEFLVGVAVVVVGSILSKWVEKLL